MKKLFLIITAIALSAFAEAPPAPPVSVSILERINISTSEVEYQFNRLFTLSGNPYQLICVTVATESPDSIAFSVGETITSSFKKFGPGEKVPPITIQNGIYNLRAKGDAANCKFFVTQ